MKKLNFSLLRGALLVSAVSLSLLSCSKDELAPETTTAQAEVIESTTTTTAKGSAAGTLNGFFRSIDTENGIGTIDMTSTSAGNFNYTWSGVRETVGGMGWDSTRRISVGYNIGFITNSSTVKFVGLYGWTRSPLTEYYVCERGGGAIFGGVSAGNNYTADNRTYVMTKAQRVQAPSIDGTKTFWQVQGKRSSAVALNTTSSINVGTHLDNFKGAMGADFGLRSLLNTGETTKAYMVFGCEAYDYDNNGNNRISGSMNATVWQN